MVGTDDIVYHHPATDVSTVTGSRKMHQVVRVEGEDVLEHIMLHHIKRMLSISLQDAPEDEHEDVPTTPADRLAFFTNAHNVLLNCQTFTGLVRKCVQLEDEVSRFDLDVSQHSIVSLRGTVDRMAFQLLPTDDPLPNHMPLVVGADGNCFPRSLSILVFRDEERHLEMRVRLVLELQ